SRLPAVFTPATARAGAVCLAGQETLADYLLRLRPSPGGVAAGLAELLMQPLRAFRPPLLNLEGPAPQADRVVGHPEPVHQGNCRLRGDGPGQLLGDEQAGTALPAVEAAAAGPGDRGRGPARDHDQGVSVETRLPVPFAEGRGRVRAGEQGGVGHGCLS